MAAEAWRREGGGGDGYKWIGSESFLGSDGIDSKELLENVNGFVAMIVRRIETCSTLANSARGERDESELGNFLPTRKDVLPIERAKNIKIKNKK